MKKLFAWLPIVLFFAAAGSMFAADQLALPALTFAGLMLLGLCAVLSGIQVVVTRQAFFLPSGSQSLRRRAESYSGPAAQLWGVFFVLFGLIFLAVGVLGLRAPGQVFSFVEQALETPAGWGALLFTGGIFVTLYSLTRILAGGASTGAGIQAQLRDVGYRLFGGVVLLIGLSLLALGFILFTSPETLTGLIQGWFPTVP
jgi:hypothetical protein